MTNPQHDAYDSPWKDVLEHAFPEFMAFYFPAAHAQIDWAQGHGFRNTELRQVVQDAELGKRFADTLAEVTLKDGKQRWIYVHIEVQGQRDTDFARRMFTYNYRLFDRYACPIASLAVLADEDEGWRPDHYGFEVLGCRHTLEFPVVKLIDYADRAESLQTDPNPFALVTVTHLRTRETKHDPQARYQAKLDLVRSLYWRGWDKQHILDLFAILDWMMRLPDTLEQQLWQAIETIEGETKMPYVTSVERLAIQRGREQGMQQGMQQGLEQGREQGMQQGLQRGLEQGREQGREQGMQQGLQRGLEQGKLEAKIENLERLLIRRFGSLDEATRKRLHTATLEQLDRWTDRILEASTVAAVFDEH